MMFVKARVYCNLDVFFFQTPIALKTVREIWESKYFCMEQLANLLKTKDTRKKFKFKLHMKLEIIAIKDILVICI